MRWYETLVDLYSQADAVQRKSIKTLIQDVTVYYFPEPMPVGGAAKPLPFIPEQLNVPSPITWLEFDMVDETGATRHAIVKIHSESDQFQILYIRPESVNPVNIQGMEGTYKRTLMRIRIKKLDWMSDDPNKKPADPVHTQLWEDIIARALIYTNILSPGALQRPLSFAKRERAMKRGLYPLKATTEIKISQHKPLISHQSTGTGSARCQHECKGHVRTYNRGRPNEYSIWVKAHLRGDPALGMKKIKYSVET